MPQLGISGRQGSRHHSHRRMCTTIVDMSCLKHNLVLTQTCCQIVHKCQSHTAFQRCQMGVGMACGTQLRRKAACWSACTSVDACLQVFTYADTGASPLYSMSRTIKTCTLANVRSHVRCYRRSCPRAGRLRLWSREDIPETQCLVSSTGHNGLAIRGHGEVQHTKRVACQRGQLAHGRILPHDDLVLGIPMSRDNLVHVLGPSQVADLQNGTPGSRHSDRAQPSGSLRVGTLRSLPHASHHTQMSSDFMPGRRSKQKR